MYRVFLADDEALIREGLEQTIPWKSLGMELVGTAQNGLQALEKIQTARPDIVLTDIRMPFLDGLELVRKAREFLPNCRFIIITGYEEFDYAYSAIQLGVSDYVLKPVDMALLCRTLVKIKRTLDSQSTSPAVPADLHTESPETSDIETEHIFLRYVTKRLSLKQFREWLPPRFSSNWFCAGILLQLDQFDKLTSSMGEEEIFDLTQKLKYTLMDTLQSPEKLILEQSIGTYFLILFDAREDGLHMLARSYIQRLRMVITEYSYTTASSDVFSGPEGCRPAFEQASHCISYAFRHGANSDIQPKDVETDSPASIAELSIGGVVQSIATFKKQVIRKELTQLESEIQQMGHNSYLYTRMMASMVYGEILKLLVEIDCPIQSIMKNPTASYKSILSCTTLHTMMQELYRFVEVICDFLETNGAANKNISQRAKIYIDVHFQDAQLSLNQVSEFLGISPNYFSALFKQSTGQSFISYLTCVRLEHAKKLLQLGGRKTYEVARQCGYENAAYFSTIFKRAVGLSPSEYYEKHTAAP